LISHDFYKRVGVRISDDYKQGWAFPPIPGRRGRDSKAEIADDGTMKIGENRP
jgi:hypothetical protein